jgi:hypothetical protein
VRDPGERVNRFGERATESTVAMLRGRLGAWFARYVDPLMDGARLPVTGCGQLGRVTSGVDAKSAFADVPIKALQVPTR